MSSDSGTGWVRLGNSITYNEIFPVVGPNMYGLKNIEIWEDPNLAGQINSNGSNYNRAINIRRDWTIVPSMSTYRTSSGYLPTSQHFLIRATESGGTSHTVINIFGNIIVSGKIGLLAQLSDDHVITLNVFGTITINSDAAGCLILNSSRSYSVVNVIGNGRIVNNSSNYSIVIAGHNKYVNIYDNGLITGRIF